MNPYKDYLLSKFDYDGAIERDGCFLLYRIYPESSELYIGELYVAPQKRKLGLGTQMANEAMMIAKAKGVKHLTCQTVIAGKEDELSMMAILSFGFKVIRAENNKISFMREVH